MDGLRRSAGVLLQDGGGRILLVRRAYRNREYGFPGGAVDAGETPRQAAVREAREEAGVDVEIDGLIGRYLLRGGGRPDLSASVFEGRIVAGEPHVVDPNEIASVAWFDPDDPPRPLLNDAVAALRDWRRGERGVVREHRRAALGD